ncbi:MAG: glycosyl transferase [Bacteroidetes bacterium]|nr:glycosyl transferase [Bacteroidota bacterium]
MYNFCTLFDSNYFSRGLTLYRSLENVCKNSFHLYIFAFDEIALNVLKQLQLKHATIISLQEFEDEELLKVKPTRNRAEYCWTATSSTILYVIENYSVEMCTYLDADMFFYSSPKPLFDEMGEKSILITEHRYSPRYNKEAKTGIYCVQFVSFKNDERGLTALKWWRDRCIEWCYARFEDGKFGDQKYLDDWTTRFEGVHVLQHLGGGVAAWNVQQYEFFKKENALYLREKLTGSEFSVVFYHYHYLRFFTDGLVELGRRVLTENVLENLYAPYIQTLVNVQKEIEKIDNSFDANGAAENNFSWKKLILYIYRKAFGIYNIYPLEKFFPSKL